ncbi:hypothetical protein PYH37_005595 [Sinorhizobium numidicum]|uniref:Uncharacterized protein n=1 Tax=Sinorhizobium numidicum TaxID=680248 RepID=A0ABY8CZ04_9HYPH|nr:hypothetical protein [Sinorhizobium numidicum]WEX77206.1 hypothetical protein PYH37_005595 [Sinorhizobium numidicum]WEX83865.1 hypothetical protein PYH38_002688 [Sinorhizobium numidicum]
MSGRNAFFASLAIALITTPAFAEECKQAHAIYADPAGIYELRFEPVGSESAVTSNHFKVKVGETGLLLDGVVMQSGEPERPNGIVMHNCPEGDVTGAELSACTVWQGVMYTVDKAGKIGLLAAEDEPAAEQILLPDFGPSLRLSSAWGEGKANSDSSDVFQLRGCAE